jgi:hypothetical protein
MRGIRNSTEAAWYLAALVDGEGCVGSYEWKNATTGRRVARRLVTIGMCDKECIDAAARAMEILGVRFSRHEHKRKGRRLLWVITASNFASIRRLAEALPLQHHAKRAKLEKAVAAFGQQTCVCGVPWDQRTPGCQNCRDRHKYRRRREREGFEGKKAAEGKTGRPRRAPPKPGQLDLIG